jgi:hypothetical protein
MRPTSKQKIKIVLWVIFAVFIGIFFTSFATQDLNYKKIATPKENTAIVLESLAPEETTPKYFYFKKIQIIYQRLGPQLF